MANTTAAIMALPGPLENIRLVGDEDKHATLLFFGETSLLPDGAKDVLTESVKTACDMLFPFSEAIRDVSRLGSENPPALVAMLTDQNLSQVRNLFMMNPAVKGYLDSVPQHPSFTPHVTLGHPDFADEVILRALAKQLYRVRFDRLAVWWNDERIEYDLSQIVEGDTMAMSEAIANFLEEHGETDDALGHSGVKGMKWGVRKSETLGISNLATGGQTVTTVPSKTGAAGGKTASIKSQNQVALSTHNIAKQLSTVAKDNQIWAKIDSDIAAKLGSPQTKLTAKNLTVVNEVVANHFTAAANNFTKAGTTARVMVSHSLSKTLNPSGNPMMHLIVGKNKTDVDAYVSLTKKSLNGTNPGTNPKKDWIVHSDVGNGVEVLELHPIVGANGFITGIKDTGLAHTDSVDIFLSHIGVKLGKKKGTKNHVLFVARGDKPKIGDQFSHQGAPHTVVGVSTAPNDAKRHMVTAKPIPKDKVKHVEWETYELGESDVDDVLEHHGVRGMKWGVRRSVNPSTGLVSRKSSEDQIHTDRIASKISKHGTSTASNKDLQDLTRRIQLESDFKRISTSPEAAKSRSWINNFIRRQSANQLDRVANKAVDIAVEHAIERAGLSISKKNPVLGQNLNELSKRLKPKKK